MHAAATSKVENSAQGSYCKLNFVHGFILLSGEYLEAPLGDSLTIGIDDILIPTSFENWALA